jgi:pyruvate,water dikinase
VVLVKGRRDGSINPGWSISLFSLLALSEDSAQASFAGEFETMLDVRTDEAIRAAIQAVRQSRGR